MSPNDRFSFSHKCIARLSYESVEVSEVDLDENEFTDIQSIANNNDENYDSYEEKEDGVKKAV